MPIIDLLTFAPSPPYFVANASREVAPPDYLYIQESDWQDGGSFKVQRNMLSDPTKSRTFTLELTATWKASIPSGYYGNPGPWIGYVGVRIPGFVDGLRFQGQSPEPPGLSDVLAFDIPSLNQSPMLYAWYYGTTFRGDGSFRSVFTKTTNLLNKPPEDDTLTWQYVVIGGGVYDAGGVKHTLSATFYGISLRIS